MMTINFPGSRYTWAGIVLRDDDGNFIAVQMAEPRVTLSVSHEASSDFSTNSGEIISRYDVTVSGIGRFWQDGHSAADDAPPASAIGIIGAPAAGKTELGRNLSAITMKSLKKEGP